eukprot:scaffold19453_cov70-Attheya_sp.AAC.1
MRQGGGRWRDGGACDSVVHGLCIEVRRDVGAGDVDGQVGLVNRLGELVMETSCIMGMALASTGRHCAGLRGCPHCFFGLMGLDAFIFFACTCFFLARRCFPRLPVLAAYVVGGVIGTVEGCLLGLIDGAV